MLWDSTALRFTFGIQSIFGSQWAESSRAVICSAVPRSSHAHISDNADVQLHSAGCWGKGDLADSQWPTCAQIRMEQAHQATVAASVSHSARYVAIGIVRTISSGRYNFRGTLLSSPRPGCLATASRFNFVDASSIVLRIGLPSPQRCAACGAHQSPRLESCGQQRCDGDPLRQR